MSVGIDGLGGVVAGARRGHRWPGGTVDGARGKVNDFIVRIILFYSI